MTVAQAARWFETRDAFLVLTHKRPDGDTTGSAAGLCLGLRKLGKTAFLAPNPDMTPRLRPYGAPLFAPPDFTPGYYVAVDTASESLLPEGALPAGRKADLAVDHHPDGGAYADARVCDEKAAACGEIVYALLEAMHIELDKDIANALYVAVSTDTGCFRFGSTTSGTLRCGAALMDAGAEADAVNKAFFETKSQKRMAVESILLRSLSYHMEGHLAVAHLAYQDLQAIGAQEDDLENISAVVRQIEGVEIGVLIREEADGSCKLSARSSDQYQAGTLCRALGGGGHDRAAGATLHTPLPEARALVLETALGLFANPCKGY